MQCWGEGLRLCLFHCVVALVVPAELRGGGGGRVLASSDAKLPRARARKFRGDGGATWGGGGLHFLHHVHEGGSGVFFRRFFPRRRLFSRQFCPRTCTLASKALAASQLQINFHPIAAIQPPPPPPSPESFVRSVMVTLRARMSCPAQSRAACSKRLPVLAHPVRALAGHNVFVKVAARASLKHAGA